MVHAALQIAQLRQQGVVVGSGRLRQRLAHRCETTQQLHLLATAGEHLLQHRPLRIERGVLVHQHHIETG